MRRSFYLCACGQVFAGRQIGGHRAKGGCMKKYRPIPKAQYKQILIQEKLTEEAKNKPVSLPQRPVKSITRQYPEEIEIMSKQLAKLKAANETAQQELSKAMENYQKAEQELSKADQEYENFKAGLQKLIGEAE